MNKGIHLVSQNKNLLRSYGVLRTKNQTLVLLKARDLTPTRKRGEARHRWQTTSQTVAALASTINQSSILPKAPTEFHPGKLYLHQYQESSRPNKRNMFLLVE